MLAQVRLAALKREEDGLQRERERLETEKERHFRRASAHASISKSVAPCMPSAVSATAC